MIPVCEPLIGSNVLPLVRECIETGWMQQDRPGLRRLSAETLKFGCYIVDGKKSAKLRAGARSF